MDEQRRRTYTEDRATVYEGSRAFNYYDHKPGTVGPIEPDGWFTFTHDDGTRAILDGSRICSTDYAARRGWMTDRPDYDDELSRHE